MLQEWYEKCYSNSPMLTSYHICFTPFFLTTYKMLLEVHERMAIKIYVCFGAKMFKSMYS